jgi:hypothetical protein
MTVFCSLLALAGVGGAALAAIGVDTVRNSRAGKVVSTVTDPAAPGFEAFLEPTPTLALLHREGSSVRSIAVLSLHSGDVGGSVLVVSPWLQANPGADAGTFAVVSAFGGGPEAIMHSLQASIRFGVTETALVDDALWAELVAPVAPLVVENPTAVASFPAGSLSLRADQVGAFLAAGDKEPPQAAMLRQRAFYRAWIGAVSASTDRGVVPGEVESGLGRFVRALANGPTIVEQAPVVEDVVGGVTRYGIDLAAMEAMVPELVPFPTAGTPGGRIRVRLLDGTGDGGHVEAVAPLLVPAGAQIVVVGNADRFDYRETEVQYHTPVVRGAAGDLVEALAVGRVVEVPRQTDAFDVTIILGTDV